MKKKLLSFVLSILMIATVLQVNVHASSSITGFDFDILLDDISYYQGWTYAELSFDMKDHIIQLEEYSDEFQLSNIV